MKTEAKPHSMQQRADDSFRLRVLGANPAHVPASSRFAQGVHGSQLDKALLIEDAIDDICYPVGKQGWYGVADLDVLRASWSLEEVVVGKGLQSGGFPYREAAALRRVKVYEMVPVLRQVGCDGR
jgi:hypothetical protein